MQFISLFFSIIILGISSGCFLRSEGQVFDWPAFKRAVDSFIALPSMENSRKLLKAIPESADRTFLEHQEGSFRYLCEGKFLIEDGLEGWERYPIFEYELWAGNPYVIRIALRLYVLAENLPSVRLCASISTLIRIRPGSFLKALDEMGPRLDPSKLSSLLTCFPNDYFLSTQAIQQELLMRLSALERIKTKRLAQLQENCRAIIKKQMNEIESSPFFTWPVSVHYQEGPPESVRMAFEEFVRCPSNETARAFRDSIPLHKENGYTDKIQGLIFLGGRSVERSQGYLVLEREALAGNRNAAEALFRMYAISPGGLDTRELRESLSKLIRINPRLFLETLRSFEDVLDPDWKESLVLFLPAYFQEKSQMIHEYTMRQKALAGVTTPSLRELNEYCFNSLDKAIRIRSR